MSVMNRKNLTPDRTEEDIKKERKMETRILDSDQLTQAAGILKRGGLVAIPTETVYGLAADALNGNAVKKIFEAKGRPADNPLIVHISELSQINQLVREFTPQAQKLAQAFWPGPLTIILPKSPLIPDEVSAGLDTVAVRFPSHPVARALISLSGPLAAPSANLSGSPSPTSLEHVVRDMNGRVDAIVDGGDCEVGVESTVITLACSPARLLRPGGVTAAQLREVLGEVIIDDAVTGQLREGEKAASPGMKYKHYSPRARVILIESDRKTYLDYVNSRVEKGTAALCYDEDIESLRLPYISIGGQQDSSAHAHRLFAALREADDRGFERVYAHCPETDGLELAVYNRMIRASGFCIIRPGDENEA